MSFIWLNYVQAGVCVCALRELGCRHLFPANLILCRSLCQRHSLVHPFLSVTTIHYLKARLRVFSVSGVSFIPAFFTP
ncbi:MAG: hypothetical protein ACI9HK_002551 [Pirellulaceae bacterium]|jgi:hypothetical protein